MHSKIKQISLLFLLSGSLTPSTVQAMNDETEFQNEGRYSLPPVQPINDNRESQKRKSDPLSFLQQEILQESFYDYKDKGHLRNISGERIALEPSGFLGAFASFLKENPLKFLKTLASLLKENTSEDIILPKEDAQDDIVLPKKDTEDDTGIKTYFKLDKKHQDGKGVKKNKKKTIKYDKKDPLLGKNLFDDLRNFSRQDAEKYGGLGKKYEKKYKKEGVKKDLEKACAYYAVQQKIYVFLVTKAKVSFSDVKTQTVEANDNFYRLKKLLEKK